MCEYIKRQIVEREHYVERVDNMKLLCIVPFLTASIRLNGQNSILGKVNFDAVKTDSL